MKNKSIKSSNHVPQQFYRLGFLILAVALIGLTVFVALGKFSSTGKAVSAAACPIIDSTLPSCVDTDNGIKSETPGVVVSSTESVTKAGKKKEVNVFQDVCVPGSTDKEGFESEAQLEEYYCENGKKMKTVTKCGNTAGGPSCNSEKTACAPECSSSASCQKKNQLFACLDKQCANVFQEVQCQGDSYDYDTLKQDQITLAFGGYELKKEDLSGLGFEYYQYLNAASGYPFKEFCINKTHVFEMSCNNQVLPSAIKGALKNTDKKLMDGGYGNLIDANINYGTLIAAKILPCPKEMECFEGACVKTMAVVVNPVMPQASKIVKMS